MLVSLMLRAVWWCCVAVAHTYITCFAFIICCLHILYIEKYAQIHIHRNRNNIYGWEREEQWNKLKENIFQQLHVHRTIRKRWPPIRNKLCVMEQSCMCRANLAYIVFFCSCRLLISFFLYSLSSSEKKNSVKRRKIVCISNENLVC